MGQNTFKIAFEDGVTKSASINIISPKDVIMFVAGTTDPINTTAANHQSNRDYWRSTKADLKNLRASVKEFKPQFNDLHIEDEFFSWSGDNNNTDRTTGANRLLDLIYRLYPNWKNEDIYFHFIGHSHGGNVINEYTNVIANDGSFPEKWKVKSITYLSTPFFKEQHQLNAKNLHPDCKIINVHNKYDITQRFVADFSLKNLEILLADFNKEDFKAGLERIEETNFTAFDHLSDLVINNHTEGPFLWQQATILLDGIEQVLTVLINKVNCLQTTTIFAPQKVELLGHLRQLLNWASTQGGVFERNQNNRDGGYGRSEFFDDIDLIGILGIINVLFEIDKNEDSSYLLGLLNSISQTDESGIVDRIDDTSWSPKKQVNNKFEIVDIPIYTQDPYHSKNKQSDYDAFINGIEDAVKNNKNDIREVAMRLLSQLMTPNYLGKLDTVIDTLNTLAIINFGALDTALKLAMSNFKSYRSLINKYNKNLVTDKDLANSKLEVKPGSLVYLAINAHSLSHTKLFPEVEQALRDSFGSGINPGFKN
ncbi:hypothetical protein V6251_11235 [Olleya sp. Ti.3.14]|uniref:hypothetical protein n=1 Tax=Olleya sp. Ti.3.14 TaxID=3121297 RepID=UPI00311DF5F6